MSTVDTTSLFVVDTDTAPLKVACALFAPSNRAVTRISQVGLSGREATRLLVTARCYYGLVVELSRSASGSITLTFSPPAHQAATEIPREQDHSVTPATTSPSGTPPARERPWWRFWQRG